MSPPSSTALPQVLFVSSARSGADEALRELRSRQDLRVRVVDSAEEAAPVLAGEAVMVVVLGADVPAAVVDRVLAELTALRLDPPVLVIRHHKAKESPAWAGRRLGVLRRPLAENVVSRSVDVVLGLTVPVSARRGR